jgi:predicted outer membrane repeat protein
MKKLLLKNEKSRFTIKFSISCMKIKVLNILFFLGFFSTTFANTWFVNSNAAGANTGANWSNAFIDLQSAISASAFGDQIWVAAGTYKPTLTSVRTIYFEIKNGTKVYGGFDGNETLLNERNPITNVTILSGDIATTSGFDNSYHVVYFWNTGNQTLLNGFTITAGNAILNGSADAGGGIYASSSSAVIEDCKFISNIGDYGGAFAQVNSGICTVKKCVFEANISNTIGGAVYLSNDMAFFTDCYFNYNQSSGDGGAVYLNSSVFNFDRCVFAGNTSVDDGSVFYVGNFAALILSNSLLVGNYASGQEVISMSEFLNQQINQMTNCTVAHNRQLQNGSGTRAITMNSISTITNSIIWDNGGDAEVLASGLSISNCIIQPAANNASGTNVLSIDPQFTNAGALNSAPFDTSNLDYHLGLFSPGIDYGLNINTLGTLDLDSETRIQNIVDLGAYESSFCTSPLTLDQSGPFIICGGTPVTISVSDAIAYNWSTGSSNASITVNNAGNYSVVFEDADGCRGGITVPVLASNLPNPTIVFVGGNLSVGVFNTYQWNFNGTPINGAIQANHIPLEGYGEYTVEITNNAGCVGENTFCLSPAIISANGPTAFCAGGSVTLTAENGSSFVWSNGELDSEITVSVGGTYAATILNTLAGCSVTLTQLVTVLTNPIPVINFSAGNLTTGTFATYQWYYEGNLINGATSSTLMPTNGNGAYTVVVSNTNDCEGTSLVYNYNNADLSEEQIGDLYFFPNPVSRDGKLFFHTPFDVNKSALIRLYNICGKLCFESSSNEIPESLDLFGIDKGVYILELTIEQRNIRKNLVID